jgi:hypothetical protein
VGEAVEQALGGRFCAPRRFVAGRRRVFELPTGNAVCCFAAASRHEPVAPARCPPRLYPSLVCLTDVMAKRSLSARSRTATRRWRLRLTRPGSSPTPSGKLPAPLELVDQRDPLPLSSPSLMGRLS